MYTFFYDDGDNFAKTINDILLSLDSSLHLPLNNLFNIFKSYKLSKPNKKFEKDILGLVEYITIDNYTIISKVIIDTLINTEKSRDIYDDKTILLSRYNSYIFRNFLFSTIQIIDNEILYLLKKMILKHYNLIELVSNSAIYVMSRYKDNYSISSMQTIREKIKTKSIQKLIDKYILEIAKERNMSVHELYDISVPDFELTIN